MTSRILFICKNRELAAPYNGTDNEYTYSAGGKSSGLYNSVKFMVDMLNQHGIEAKLADVADNNCIDREVNAFKPTHVIIEALWVVPTKFEVLTKLHPTVQWFIRLHSDIPFLANEGIAFDWLAQYGNYPNVFLAANSDRISNDLEELFDKPVAYLPNFYPIENTEAPKAPVVARKPTFSKILDSLLNKIGLSIGDLSDSTESDQLHYAGGNEVHIGCFGAIRPLKNQLIQAVAAIRFANKIGKTLHFHINGNRVEGKGDPVLKNIRKLFEHHPTHCLVEHAWMDHDTFVNLLGQLDITMQVSFTETYNIVAADSIAALCPVLTSSEIDFVPSNYHANPVDSDDMTQKLYDMYKANKQAVVYNQYNGLTKDAQKAKTQWGKFLSC